MKDQTYSQCVLEREEQGQKTVMAAWIFSRHKMGAQVRDEDGKIWVIKQKGLTEINSQEANEMSQRFKKHRKATDI